MYHISYIHGSYIAAKMQRGYQAEIIEGGHP
jgi:hypothetical protein